MSKKTRKERREEERKIIEQMQEGLAGNVDDTITPSEQSEEVYDSTAPTRIHCRRCKTLMENGVCPVCGYKIYIPMDKAKRKKIRLIVGGMCLAVCIVLVVVLR